LRLAVDARVREDEIDTAVAVEVADPDPRAARGDRTLPRGGRPRSTRPGAPRPGVPERDARFGGRIAEADDHRLDRRRRPAEFAVVHDDQRVPTRLAVLAAGRLRELRVRRE